jgi:hypothetical protein
MPLTTAAHDRQPKRALAYVGVAVLCLYAFVRVVVPAVWDLDPIGDFITLFRGRSPAVYVGVGAALLCLAIWVDWKNYKRDRDLGLFASYTLWWLFLGGMLAATVIWGI